MAKDTPDKIRRAALQLFSTRWFETVSIAEICREAEVSNGVFYRYYSNKGELVRDLLDEFLAQFEAELQAIDGDSPDQRLGEAVRRNLQGGFRPCRTGYGVPRGPVSPSRSTKNA
jgi:AcrR family transcriptional regulator